MCRTTLNVTFFNKFGDSFLHEYEQIKEKPVFIIIGFGKVSEWKGNVTITELIFCFEQTTINLRMFFWQRYYM